MIYQEFVEAIKQKAHEELGFALENMTVYPKGFKSDDPKITEWIQDSNMRYVGIEHTSLLTDILTIKVPEEEPEKGSKVEQSKSLEDDSSVASEEGQKDGLSNGPSKKEQNEDSERGKIATVHRIAIRKMYEDAEQYGFDTVFQDISKLQESVDEAQIDREQLKVRATNDYDVIREHLIIRPLNYKLHIRELKNCVYRKVNDFVLVLYQLISDKNDSIVTSKIRREELKRWGMEDQEDQVFQDALTNTARLYPPCVYDQRTGQEENFYEKDFTRKDISMMNHILLSTFTNTNGAVSLFYPGVVQKMMTIMDGPFAAVFMNTNDVMIFGRNDSRIAHFAMTAKKSGALGEMLSGKPYLCDGKQMIPGVVMKVYDGENGRRIEVED